LTPQSRSSIARHAKETSLLPRPITCDHRTLLLLSRWGSRGPRYSLEDPRARGVVSAAGVKGTPDPTMFAVNGWGAMPYPSWPGEGLSGAHDRAPAIEARAEEQAIGGSIERLCR
jgi:hypothetical protein